MAKERTPAAAKPKQWHCAVGTRNMLGNVYSYASESAARGRGLEALEEQEQWCHTYNKAGLDALFQAKNQVRNTSLSMTPKEIVCVFDEHTGMAMKITLWNEKPTKKGST